MSYGSASGMANDLTRRSLLISGSHDCMPTRSPTKLAGSWKVENYHKKENKWILVKKSIKTRGIVRT